MRERGIPAGFKDLGAGGVACATSELAAAGGRGARHRARATSTASSAPLPPEVLLCAETQERFCWVVPEAFAAELCAIYNREFALGDDLPGRRRARHRRARSTSGATASRWEGETLVDCPVRGDHHRAARVQRPARRRAPAAARTRRGARAATRAARCSRCSASSTLCSREYLFRHYDSEVQGRTWLRPGEGDAAVIRAHPERAARGRVRGRRQSVLVRGRSRARRARTRWPRRRATWRARAARPVGAHRLPQLRAPRGPRGDGRPRGHDRGPGRGRRGAGRARRAAARRCRS